jgi:transmembrane 9 superfamily member 1
MISGDVFRSPDYLNLFCACIGSGAQLFTTAIILLCFVLFGVFKATRRGALLTAAIIIYAVAGSVGGFVAARLFKQLKGLNWVWNVVLTSFLFPTPLFLVFCWVNGVAWTQQSTAALPLTTILLMLSIFIFVHFPLTVAGAIAGRNVTEDYKPPHRFVDHLSTFLQHFLDFLYTLPPSL